MSHYDLIIVTVCTILAWFLPCCDKQAIIVESLQENLIFIFQQDHDNWSKLRLKQIVVYTKL